MRLSNFITFGSTILLGGCLTAEPPPTNEQRRERIEAEERTDKKANPARSSAVKHESKARGTRRCSVQHNPAGSLSSISNLLMRIFESGQIGVSVWRDTYPGTDLVILLSGKRYSGPVHSYVMLDAAALAAIKGGRVVSYSWYAWPSRQEQQEEVTFHGFAPAYEECLRFLKSPPK